MTEQELKDIRRKVVLASPKHYKYALDYMNENADDYISKHGKTEYNRYVNYYTIRSAAVDNGIDISMIPGLAAVDDLINNRKKYTEQYGKKGYDQVYSAYLTKANPDIDKINKVMGWKNGDRFSADLLNSSQYLKDKYVYDPKNTDDVLAQSLGYVPSAFNQETAREIVSFANKIKESQKPPEESSNKIPISELDKVAAGNRPVTEAETREAIEIINAYYGFGSPEKVMQAKQERHELPMPYPGAPSHGIYNSLENAKRAQYAWEHMAMPYPGAPTPVNQMDLAELDEEITRVDSEFNAMRGEPTTGVLGFPNFSPDEQQKLDYLNGLKTYRADFVRRQITDNPPQTVEANHKMIADIEAQKAQLDKNDPLYPIKINGYDIQLQVLKDNGFYLEQAEEAARIVQEVTNAPDYESNLQKAKTEPDFLSGLDPSSNWRPIMKLVNEPDSNWGISVDLNNLRFLKDEERNIIKYYYGAKDWKGFEKYYDAISYDLDARMNQKIEENRQKESKPVAAIKSIIGAPFKVGATLESGAQSIENLVTGKYAPVNPNSTGMQLAKSSDELRQYVTEDFSDAGKWWANLGFSMADMVFTLPMGGPSMSLHILSSEAAGQTSYDILQRGGTPEEAFWGGVAAGATEAMTEKIPLEHLFNIAKSGVKFFSKQGLKKILKQAGIEGTEEWIAGMFEAFEDYAIMGDKSQLGMRINELIKSGINPGEAQKQAFNEIFVLNPIYDAAGGTLSGGFFGIGAVGISNISMNQQSAQQNAQQNQQSVQDSVSPVAQSEQQNIQAQNGNMPALSKADGYVPGMLNEKVRSKIQENIQANPEGVRNALTEGMTVLINIEARIKADSSNIKQSAINIKVSHSAYTDFASGKAGIETVAAVMAGDIRSVIRSGELTVPEIVRLGYILTDIVGDADLAGEYLRPAFDAPGADGDPWRGGLGPAMAGVTPGDASKPLNDGRIQPFKSFDEYKELAGNRKKKFVENPFDENGKLKLDVKYKSGEFGYNYETDNLGRIVKFSTNELQITSRDKRLRYNPNTPGKLHSDHAGHLAGDLFGGSEELDNIVTQLQKVNLSAYKKIENIWAKEIRKGKKVGVNVDIIYEGDSLRPSGFMVKYEIDGKRFRCYLKN